MRDRPIIFSGPMVRAILDGRKTQTRRVAKLKRGISIADISEWIDEGNGVRRAVFQRDQIAEPPYATGDRLWVKHAADCFPVYFRPITFGDGKYAVGTDGHVYARDGDEWTKRAHRLSHNGYEEISLRFNGDQRPFRINRLVADAFYGPAPDGYVCRHIDGDRRNNAPGNLDWGTPAQNSADASAAGSFSGERASNARLSSDDVEQIRMSSEPQAVLADRFGVTQPTISKIKSGKLWSGPGEAPPRNFPAFHLWMSPIFCPRWASRLTLIVEGVRVHRVQDISDKDAEAEGLSTVTKDGKHWKWGIADSDGLPGNDDDGWHWQDWNTSPVEAYARLWDSLNAGRVGCSWSDNPWVCAVSFHAHMENIDAT